MDNPFKTIMYVVISKWEIKEFSDFGINESLFPLFSNVWMNDIVHPPRDLMMEWVIGSTIWPLHSLIWIFKRLWMQGIKIAPFKIIPVSWGNVYCLILVAISFIILSFTNLSCKTTCFQFAYSLHIKEYLSQKKY